LGEDRKKTQRKEFNTSYPHDQIHPTCWIAPGAVVVGDVTLEELTSVWFNASLRADDTPIIIRARSNIQENCVFHADPGFPAEVGEGCTIGHAAVIHGAKVGENCTIGMRAVLMNGVIVGENSIVGAGSLLTQGKVYPPNSLILGAPAKVIREVTEDEIAFNRYSSDTYVNRSRAFMSQANAKENKG